MAKAELRVSIDADVKAALDALAKASKKHPATLVERALRIILDPLPVLESGQATLAALLQRQAAVEDQIRVVADFVIDAHRASADESEQEAYHE